MSKRTNQRKFCSSQRGGGVTETIASCTQIQVGNKISKFTTKVKENMLELSETMNSDGLRVVAVAYKYFQYVLIIDILNLYLFIYKMPSSP